jgi:hypothetical protein
MSKSVLSGALSGAATGAGAGAALGPYGALVGGIVGLGAGLFGGVSAAKKRKAMEQRLYGDNAQNDAWYRQNALTDSTQRTDVQALMRNLRDNLKQRSQTTAGMAAVTGATPEQQAAQMESDNKALADAWANVGAYGQQYKDRVTDVWLNRKDRLGNQITGMLGSQATGYENLMNGGLSMAGGALESYLNTLYPKPATTKD